MISGDFDKKNNAEEGLKTEEKKKHLYKFGDASLKIKTREKQYIVIQLEGYINSDNSEMIIDIINDIKFGNDSPLNYFFILNKLEYISSAGVGIFMDLFDFLEDKGGNVVFVEMQESVRRVFDIVGFLQYFGDYTNLKDALENYIN